jgi:PAT family beta-lactamase induction signal transducer AmpG
LQKNSKFLNFSPQWLSFAGLFILGTAGGLLLELSDSLLRLWGRDLGYSPKDMDMLNVVELLYTLKFLWSPLLCLPLGWRFWGDRRAWIMMMLFIGIGAYTLMWLSPFWGLIFMVGLMIVTVARSGFDMLVVASQMDAAPRSQWGFNENFCMNGYRLGIVIASSSALALSHNGWSWQTIYGIVIALAAFMWIIIGTSRIFRFLDNARPSTTEGFWKSLSVWLQQPGSYLVLILMITYRLQDSLCDPNMLFFLLDSGLSKMDLSYLKPIVMWTGIAGGALSGFSIRYLGYSRTLFLALGAHTFMALLFWLQTLGWIESHWLVVLYPLKQFTRGWAMLSFFSFQLICCQKEYAVSQLALLTALAYLGTKLGGVRSGWLAQEMGWHFLFGLAFCINLPVFILLRNALNAPFLRSKLSRS